MNKYLLNSIICILVLAFGVLIGWLIAKDFYFSQTKNTATQVRVDLPQYTLINPLLFSDTPKSTDPALTSLATSINSYIASTTKNKEAESVSVYFRDLNSGQWTGVNENDTYTPSSMLKVVAMMAALKLAEQDPSILTEKLLYQASSSSFVEYYYTDDGFTTGEYEVQDLIGAMIKYSDNDALDALLSDPRINNEFNEIYSLFRLPQVSGTDPTDYMSPKSYAEVFRALYNSTLFQWDLSEQVLNLLGTTTFTEGLVAGVPASTTVAHKFGENTSSINNGNGTTTEHELHDCGIIYYPGKPYLLCVMTKGQDFPTLAGVIAGISNLVYMNVSGHV